MATSAPSWPSSSVSANGRAAHASTGPSRASARPISNSSPRSTRAVTRWWRTSRATRQPVAIARLVRDGRSAEIAFEVADEYQQLGIGSALTTELIADARAAGITEITALVSSDNPAALALLRRILNVLDVRFEGPELSIRAALL